MCFAYRPPVHAVAVILLPSRAESTIDTGYSNVPSVLTDVKARLQMMLRYGRALIVSRIAGQPLANQLMPRGPAHALSEWHRSGRAALNAAGGQVRTSVRKVTLCAKLATAFGKRPVAAKKPTDRHATAMANDPRPHESSSLRNPKSGNVIRLSLSGRQRIGSPATSTSSTCRASRSTCSGSGRPSTATILRANAAHGPRDAVEQSRPAIGNWNVRGVT